MQSRKFILSVFILLFTATCVFGQSEALKVVVNSLGYYQTTKDINWLARAKKSVDSLIVSRKDSNNIEKGIYKSLVYGTILQVDTLNTLNLPADFSDQTALFVDKLADHPRIRRYDNELDFVKECIANAYVRQGFSYINKSDFINAEQNFRKAQRYAPAYKPINAYLAYANNKLGNLQEAAKFYNTLVNSGKPSAEYIQTAANINMAIGDTTRALELLKKGRSQLPDDTFLAMEEANIYNNKKDYKALETLLPVIIAQSKNNAAMAFVAANCYDQLNKYDKAEEYYLKAVELDGADFEPIFNLGVLYYKKTATEKGKDDMLKNVYYASKCLEKASEISPNDVRSLQLLKDIYSQTGNTKQLNKVNNKLIQLTDK